MTYYRKSLVTVSDTMIAWGHKTLAREVWSSATQLAAVPLFLGFLPLKLLLTSYKHDKLLPIDELISL